MEKQYLDGFPSCIWGSAFWHVLHMISFSVPEKIDDIELKNNLYNFFKNLGTVLPCKECADHYNKNFNLLSLENNLNSRDSLSRWVYNLHNLVNEQTGVSKDKWPSYKEVYDKFMSLKLDTCSSNTCSSSDLTCHVSLVPKNKEYYGINNNNFYTGNNNYIFIGIGIGIIIIIIVFLLYKKNIFKYKK